VDHNTNILIDVVNILMKFCEQEIFDFHGVMIPEKIRSKIKKIISNRYKVL
jgi:hypothetical protein